ncbi:hypothetical protein TNCV_4032491 [Trichonephila clavipes]|nr:hypothetical protein TNCV_4032491 [Trichonephila clavipes]
MAYLCTSRAGWLAAADCFRNDQIFGIESNGADLECKVEQGNGDRRPLRTVGVQGRGPVPGHSSVGSINTRKNFILACSTHHGVQQGRQCAGHLAKTRHGAYLEYTQNIMLQHQGEDPTGKPDTLICSTNPTAVSLRRLRRELPPAD